MSRQDLVLKWSVYGLALLPLWALERLVLVHFPLFGVFPVLLPFAAVAVAVLEGPVAGVGYGMFAGLVCTAVYVSNGWLVLALSCLCFLVGLVTKYGLRQNFLGFFLCSAFTLSAIDGARILSRLLRSTADLSALLAVAAPEILWSLCFTPLVYLVYRLVYRRVGDTILM